MSKKGVLTVISGFSGAGKGTIMKQLIEKYPYFLSISATTRKPREGEVNGREYYFHTREEFEHINCKDKVTKQQIQQVHTKQATKGKNQKRKRHKVIPHIQKPNTPPPPPEKEKKKKKKSFCIFVFLYFCIFVVSCF